MTDPKPVTLKANPADVAAWERCAAECSMSRQAWCNSMLNIASGQSALDDHVALVTEARESAQKS